MTTKEKNTAETDDVVLTDLSTEDWGARMGERFPTLLRSRFSAVCFDIPAGWRPLVEETLESVQRICKRRGLSSDDEGYPALYGLAEVENVLLLQFLGSDANVEARVNRAIAQSVRVCQRCGEESLSLKPLEVDAKLARLERLVPRTRRLCPECVAQVRPQPDPARSLQVLAYVTDTNERRDQELIKAYREALVETRTPLSPVPDLEMLCATLMTEFPWMSAVTDYLMAELVALKWGVDLFRLPPLLLSGPPGIGKTSYVRRLAELSGVVFRVLPLAGVSSSMLIKGASRGWSSARPGLVLELIKQTGVANPVIVLDELDKAGGSSWNGNAQDALLGLLEPSTTDGYVDEFLQGPADLSWVSWIATANETWKMSGPLLSRLQEIKVPSPRREDYPPIVERTVRSYATGRGIPLELMPRLGDAEWATLGRFFTTPRAARMATERLLSALLARPGLDGSPIQ